MKSQISKIKNTDKKWKDGFVFLKYFLSVLALNCFLLKLICLPICFLIYVNYVVKVLKIPLSLPFTKGDSPTKFGGEIMIQGGRERVKRILSPGKT